MGQNDTAPATDPARTFFLNLLEFMAFPVINLPGMTLAPWELSV
jgi:hypothetical protein